MASVTRRTRRSDTKSGIGIEKTLAEAMERLLSEGHSFTSLSVEELAHAAGIGRSTFYTHFRDKGQLVHRLMQSVAAEMVAAGGRWFSDTATASRNDLTLAIKGITDVYEKHYAILSAAVETASYDAEVRRHLDDMMKELCATSREALKRLQRAGRAPVELSVDIADSLTWMVERCCYQMLHARTRAQREKLVAAMSEIIWRTLVDPPRDLPVEPSSAAKPRRRLAAAV